MGRPAFGAAQTLVRLLNALGPGEPWPEYRHDLAVAPGSRQLVARMAESLRIYRERRAPLASTPRIGFLLWTLQPFGGVISVLQLAADLKALGVDARVAVLDPRGAGFDLARGYGVDVVSAARHMEQSWFIHQCDLVAATYWLTMIVLARAHLDHPRFLPAYFVQDFESGFVASDDPEMRERARDTYRLTPYCFAKTPWICGQVREAGGAIAWVPPAVDRGVFYPSDVARGPGHPLVLSAMLRPSTPRRGFGATVEVLRRVHAERPDTRIEVFGMTEEEQRRHPLPFPAIQHGRLAQREVAELCRRSDLFLECSQWHGFGRTVAEAMACGTACVITDSGGVNLFARHGENCLMAAPDDMDTLTAYTLRLLKDDAERATLASAGPAAIQPFDRVTSARETLSVLRGFLEEGT